MANNIDIKDFTLGTAKTVKSTDNAGTHTPHHNVDSSALPTGASTDSKLDELKALIGEVQASPTANTVLDRLKAGTFDKGAQLIAASLAVDLATDSAVRDILGLLADTAEKDPSASASIPEILKGILSQVSADEYDTVAASLADQALGATGAAGDFLHTVWIFPATTSPGSVVLKDGVTTVQTLHPGGADSVSNLIAFPHSFGITSVNGAWNITTGANVSVLATGRFT